MCIPNNSINLSFNIRIFLRIYYGCNFHFCHILYLIFNIFNKSYISSSLLLFILPIFFILFYFFAQTFFFMFCDYFYNEFFSFFFLITPDRIIVWLNKLCSFKFCLNYKVLNGFWVCDECGLDREFMNRKIIFYFNFSK